MAMEHHCRDLQGWAEAEETESHEAGDVERKLAEREHELMESERELEQLREELAEAERQRILIEEEELGLLEAAKRVERRIMELRKEFRQSEQRATELHQHFTNGNFDDRQVDTIEIQWRQFQALPAQHSLGPGSNTPHPQMPLPMAHQKPDFTFGK